MNIARTLINLYAIPESIVPDEAISVPSTCSVPRGLLPKIVTRRGNDLDETIEEVFAWFVENLEERDGYIPASAALPILSLDSGKYAEAIKMLREAIRFYQKVQGPVFMPLHGRGRSAVFNVADWYAKMLHGSTLSPVVMFNQALPDEAFDIHNVSAGAEN